jgi:hypothetical protein
MALLHTSRRGLRESSIVMKEEGGGFGFGKLFESAMLKVMADIALHVRCVHRPHHREDDNGGSKIDTRLVAMKGVQGFRQTSRLRGVVV